MTDDEAEVEAPIADPLFDLSAHAGDHVEPDFRIALPRKEEHGCHKARRQRRDASNVHDAAADAGGCLDLRFEAPCLLEQHLRIRKNALSEFGEGDTTASPVKQSPSAFRLQRSQLPAQRGRASVIEHGRLRKASQFSYLDEDFQLFDVHERTRACMTSSDPTASVAGAALLQRSG